MCVQQKKCKVFSNGKFGFCNGYTHDRSGFAFLIYNNVRDTTRGYRKVDGYLILKKS